MVGYEEEEEGEKVCCYDYDLERNSILIESQQHQQRKYIIKFVCTHICIGVVFS
jgi:hypothetical protein